MKNLLTVFIVCTIGLLPTGSNSGEVCDQEPYILEGSQYIMHAKNKLFSSGCKHKCYHICNPEKRDIHIELSLLKLSIKPS
jgi:hypothetical protein